MNIKYFLYGFISIGLITAIGCSKQLNKFPADQISLDQAFQTVQDAGTWDQGLYAILRGRVYGTYTYTTDVQGDQLNASVDFGNRNGGPQRWDWVSTDYTLSGVWSGYYYGITNANVVIAGIKSISPKDASEAAELKTYTGDAYFSRAYYYSQLVLKFAKAYNTSSASTDLGVPIVTTYDIDNWPARSSISDVYNFILTDLDSAASNLASVTGKQGSNIFTLDAVTALKARVKLYMQDWVGAKTEADKLISGGKYVLYSTSEGLKDMWVNDAKGEDILQLYTSTPSELPNTNSIYLGYNAATKGFAPDFIPSQWVVDMYSDTDIRKSVYFAKLPISLSGANSELKDSLYLVNKFSGNPLLWTGANTNYAQAPKVFRIAEDYLISAEGAYMSGDNSSALATLNLLREARGLNPLSVSGNDLLTAIRDERTKELAFEGFRIDDLKRWALGFTRHLPQNTKFLSSGSGFYELSQAANADKFVWGIPSNDITVVGSSLVQNSGW